MTEIAAFLTGTIAGKPLSGSVVLAGAPARFCIEVGTPSDPVSLEGVWDGLSHLLERTIGVGLAEIPEGPWKKLVLERGFTATLWLAPHPPTGEEQTPAYLELDFTEPIHIGGSESFGPVTLTLKPDIDVLGVIATYDKRRGGLTIRSKITKSAAGPHDKPATPTHQLAAFPFPLPAQDSVKAFQLNYFGIGQHIGLPAVGQSADPLAALFTTLKDALKATDPAEILTDLARQFYRPERDWFVAADLSLREFQLRVLFNDPIMYGLEIEVPGTSSSFFAGLLFEILYQKLGPDLGVYYGALTLPPNLRRIPLDPVILILPGFSLWVYTNGDFKVNVGWPLGDNSIGIMLGELVGRAGFYFAKLRTADDPGAQPSINYNPILQFGLGLGVYAGASISASIFSATLSASLTATLQGVLAWRATTSGGAASLANPPDHYWFAGVANVAVLLQGSVDFSILKAAVTVSLTATADVAVETGCQTRVDVSAEVSVDVSITVVFFTIDLSFSMTVSHTFIVGGGNAVASISGPNDRDLVFQRSDAMQAVAAVTPPATERFEAVVRLAARMQEALPLAGAQHPSAMPDRIQSAGAPRTARHISVLFVLQPTVLYNSVPPQAAVIASLLTDCPARGALSSSATGFEGLVAELVVWLLGGLVQADMSAPLSDLLRQVSDDLGTGNAAPPGGFDAFVDAVHEFLSERIVFDVTGVTPDRRPSNANAAMLPMFDALALQTEAGTVEFASQTPVSADYARAVSSFYAGLGLVPAATDEALPILVTGSEPSMARWVFGDYFLLLARHVVGKLLTSALDYENAQATALKVAVEGEEPDHTRVLDLAIDHLAALSHPKELAALLDQFDYADTAGTLSRFLLGGLQLPIPATAASSAATATNGLYALTGQQIAVAPGKTLAQATLSVASALDWLNLPAGGCKASTALPVALPPAPQPTNLAIRPFPPLSAVPLVLSLRNWIAWSEPNGTATIVTLPQQLTSLAPKGLRLTARVGASVPVEAGLLIRAGLSRLKRADGHSGDVAFVYQLHGTDEQTRELIHQALLLDDATLTGASLALLYSPPGSGTAQSDRLASDVLLVKSNLSTENRVLRVSPQLAVMRAAVTPQAPCDWAKLGDVRNFLRLLWEVSVVQTAGFYLSYETEQGKGLPDALFAQTTGDVNAGLAAVPGTSGALAEFDILVTFPAAGSPAPVPPSDNSPTSVPPCGNCLVVRQVLGTGSRLEVSAFDAQGAAILHYAPTYPAGSIGFDIPFSADKRASSDIPVEELYHLVQYAIAPSDAYNESAWSLSVGPTSQANERRYRQVIPLTRFLAPSGTSMPRGSYDIIGKTVGLRFRLLDPYGNHLPELPRVDIAPRYNDPLLPPRQWPGTHVDYEFQQNNSRESASLHLTLFFDAATVIPSVDSPQRRSQWAALGERYRLIADQLADPNTALGVFSDLVGTDSLADPRVGLQKFVGDVQSQIAGGSPPENPTPVSHDMTIPVRFKLISDQSADILPVNLSIRMTRPKQLVEPDALDSFPLVSQATSLLRPRHNLSNSSEAGPLRAFAQKFEAAFAGLDGFSLKLAQRAGVSVGDPSGAVPDLWAVRLGPKGLSVAFTGDVASFALMPLNAVPLAGTIDGITYSSIDLDVWASACLRRIEAFLSPANLVALARLDARNGTAYFEALLAAKAKLAKSIASGLAPVLEDMPAGDLASARSMLENTLLANLASAYTVSTVVQAPAEVACTFPGMEAQAPELFGGVGVQDGAYDARHYSFSSASLKLVPGRQWITSLLSVAEPSRLTELLLPLRYVAAFVQHNFLPAEEYEGYVPSSWLAFVLPGNAALTMPITPISLPKPAAIPVPLPFEPSLPRPLSQDAHPAPNTSGAPGPSAGGLRQEVADALFWRYQAQLGTNLANQDELCIDVTWNAPAAIGSIAGQAPGGQSALFAALARFQSIVPLLQPQLDQIATERVADAALGRFVELVESVAEAWPNAAPATAPPAQTADVATDHFRLIFEETSLGVAMRLLGASSTGTPPARWPTLTFGAATWAPDLAQVAPADAADVADGTKWSVIATTWPERPDTKQIGLTFAGLNVLNEQSASLACSVTRNANLVEHQRTAQAFIYRTPAIRFPDPAVPLIERESLRDIAPLEPLVTILDDILGPLAEGGTARGRPALSLSCDYTYELVPGTGLVVRTPVLMNPDIDLPAPGPSETGIAARLGRSLSAWFSLTQPAVTGAAFELAFSLFARAGGQQLPLVRFHRVRILLTGAKPDFWPH